MDKLVELGKASAIGSFKLLIGNTTSSIILAVGTIIVGIFISEDAYGLYTVALIPASTVLLFQDWGIASAMIKYCAEYRSTKRVEHLRTIIVAGLTFEIASGIILMTLLLLMTDFIATTVFGKPESAFLTAIISMTVLFAGILQGAQSVFVGFERMGLNSVMLICRAIAQAVLMPLLVYLGYGAVGAAVGYTFSIIVTGLIALIIVYFEIFRKLPKSNSANFMLLRTIKPLIVYGVPIAFANIIAGILPQFCSFMMASTIDNAMIGTYKIATNFSIFLALLTFPISTVLFPAFSKIHPQTERGLLKTIFTSSTKYTAFLLVPATIAVIVLSNPLVGTIYGSKWPLASSFLALHVLSNLFCLFGNISISGLLYGLGETKMLMKLSILTLLIGLPMALILIPAFGIFGVIAVTVSSGLPSMIVSLYWIRKNYGANVDLHNSAKIFFASSIAGVATYLFLNTLIVANWIQLTLGIVFFVAIYLISAPLVGAITHADVTNLRNMFSGLPIVSEISEILLSIIQRILDVHNSSQDHYPQLHKQVT
ncbi:MAG: oligosaccharide flippase family protein [Candidatus Bathyarchaeia archaeon]